MHHAVCAADTWPMKRSFPISILGGVLGAMLLGGSYALATTSSFILGSTTANVPDAFTAVTAKNVDAHGGLNGPLIRLTNGSTSTNATALPSASTRTERRSRSIPPPRSSI
jgi:hypothetical protein